MYSVLTTCQALLSLLDMDNLSPHKEPYEVETHVIPASWLKKMRHREIKKPAGHTGGWRRGWEQNARSMDGSRAGGREENGPARGSLCEI